MSAPMPSCTVPVRGFRHEALLYSGMEDFLSRTSSFINEGLEAEEPVMVAVTRDKCDLLKERLGSRESRVHFVNMAAVGANPARIIPAWRDFVVEHGGDSPSLRGIGEPIWADRGPAEVVECQRHERLLNIAFGDAASFDLLCPYDISALDTSVIDEMYRSHPVVRDGDGELASADYAGVAARGDFHEGTLPAPPSGCAEVAFASDSLRNIRAAVRRLAAAAGVSSHRIANMVLAVNEVASNSVRHGGGAGTLRAWQETDGLVCEIRDGGRVTEPLVGRQRPGSEAGHPRGLWLVNQLCDLVQLRSSAAGTAVRLFMRAA